MELVAIDFETADNGRDSACAIGLARIIDGEVTEQAYYLIRPPRREFFYTHIHGLTWGDVAAEPTFAEIWPRLEEFIGGADYLAAHNAGFDRGVLAACCQSAGVEAPQIPFICTVKLARRSWNIRPTRLPDVCRYLVIPLNHHDAASDALACANIIVSAIEDGFQVEKAVLGSRFD